MNCFQVLLSIPTCDPKTRHASTTSTAATAVAVHLPSSPVPPLRLHLWRRPRSCAWWQGLTLSSTFRLNLSALCGIGGALRDWLGGVQALTGVFRGSLGCILFHKRLRLSGEEDECKPLPGGHRSHPAGPGDSDELPAGRGLHSSTFQLNLSQF